MPKMVVGVDAREICGQPAGKGQYVLRVLRQWQAEQVFSLVLYVRSGQTPPADIIAGRETRVVEQQGKGLLWHFRVARRLKKDKVQVFFAALSYVSAVFNRVPTVMVVHDLATFKLKGVTHNHKSQLADMLFLKWGAQRASKIMAISESTRKDLLDLVKIPKGKIQISSAAALLSQADQKVEEPLPRDGRESFFLFVGTLEPRKNISILLQAYASLDLEIRQAHPLKLAGKPGWGDEDYPAMAEKLGIKDSVLFLGYVKDEDLRKLYRVAYLVVYPSLYEGFGLPVIEGMASGTPVITSTTSSLPEVCGKAGILVDPLDRMELCQALTRLVKEPELCDRLSKEGYARSREFSWQKTSQVIADALRAITN